MQFINSIHNRREQHRTRRGRYELDEYLQSMEGIQRPAVTFKRRPAKRIENNKIIKK